MAANSDNENLLKRLLAIFEIEASEHLKTMSSLLLEMEHSATLNQQPAQVERLFREAHSLKGAARSVNLSAIETLCQALESVLALLKQRLVPAVLPARWFATVYATLDALANLLAQTQSASTELEAGAVLDIVRQLNDLPLIEEDDARAHVAKPLAVVPASLGHHAQSAPSGTETVRISTSRLTALQVHTEDLLAYKFSAGHWVAELHILSAAMVQWQKARSRVARDARAIRRGREKHSQVWDSKSLLELDKLFDAIESEERRSKVLGDQLARLEHQADQEHRALSSIVDGLQSDIRQALMLPFSSLLELMPKLVRDLARDLGKEVELHIEGASIEIDRRILEQMKDPLIHLIRNAIDHGSETADARRRSNKPVPAQIAIDIAPLEGNCVELVVSDDGAGINLDQLKATAGRLGLISPEAASTLNPAATLALMFESGLTTSPILTDLSGRGLGLAIVREKVEHLGGSICAQARDTGGTRFRMVLPTSLATFHGLLVAVAQQQFVLPSQNVEQVLSLPSANVKTVENRQAVEIGSQAVALVSLAELLGLPVTDAAPSRLQLVVLSAAGWRVACAVSAILGDQEVLVKSLGPQLRRLPNIAGATVLGPGRVVPILNVADLLKSAQHLRPRATSERTVPSPVPQQLSLLVAEDSVTARTLLRNILETAGYQVTTAVDGIDALTSLRTAHFDLVVSDVEMPRMDGFELTTRIRADQALAHLPVVLVTALESREHKERGINVGANAYIVKSSFDQSNLFQVIRRLT